MKRAGKRGKQREPMASSIKFSQRDFRHGVNDALTLSPLRDAVRDLSGRVFERTAKKGTSSPKNTGSSVTPHGGNPPSKSK